MNNNNEKLSIFALNVFSIADLTSISCSLFNVIEYCEHYCMSLSNQNFLMVEVRF